ncbi:RHS repeat-associated core domain-containing protein [Pseudomonas monteilii]|uniref:RHS repeat-associated core domain-containing protein n=1 Tax=Pseudomonas monteilii TaxID=76759 RepID=UPI00382B8756
MPFTKSPTKPIDRTRSELQHHAYTCYGFKVSTPAMPTTGFNGQTVDSITGNYHLGLGYRTYNCTLMRFHSPDSASPFGKGGLNAYAYCSGDPINYQDPSGRGQVGSKSKTKKYDKTVAGSRDKALQAIDKYSELRKYKPITDMSENRDELKIISELGKGIDAINTLKAENEAFVYSLKPAKQVKYLSKTGKIQHSKIINELNYSEYDHALEAYKKLENKADKLLRARTEGREATPTTIDNPTSSPALAEQNVNVRNQ